MTNTIRIKLISAGLVLAGTVLAAGDKLTNIPGLPGWAANAWPMVYGAAIIFRELAHIFWPDVAVPASALPVVSPQASTQPGPLLQSGGFPQPPKPL